MNNSTKFLVGFLSGILLGTPYLYYFSPHIFEGLYDVYGVGFFLMFGVLTGLLPFIPVWFNKPLWGFKKTSNGYRDTSVEKHPRLVAVLVIIILLSFLGTTLFLN